MWFCRRSKIPSNGGVVTVSPESMHGWVIVTNRGAQADLVTYGKIVGLQPKDDASWYRMALLERVVGESGPSEQHLEKALSLKPGDPSYTDELARTKMALGEYQEAASLWGDLLAGDALSKEGRKSVLVLQGQAYQAAKDYARAKKAFAAALKLDPSDDALRARVASFH